jgi:hypothetical protein
MAADWPFADPEDVAVFTLWRILRRESPILYVTHDLEDGDWQFLNGSDVTDEDPALVGLGEIVEIDPSVLELAGLALGWVAWRDSPQEPWQRSPAVDESERERSLVSDIEEYGWHVLLIPEEDEGPSFAYSVGLFKTFAHPEIVVFGLDVDLMRQMINRIGEEVRAGRCVSHGDSSPGVLEGHDVRFCDVAKEHYREHFGYARWFYRGDEFPVLQCIWPDAAGRFPTDPKSPGWLRNRQPLLVPLGEGGSCGAEIDTQINPR